MTTRDVEASASTAASGSRRRKIIAAVGIDRYQHWQRLANAVRDATETAALFCRLGFRQVSAPLLDHDASCQAIQSLVTVDLKKQLDPDDSLVLFYAGHGATYGHRPGGEEIRTGYLIPADASGSPEDISTWIDLEGWLRSVALLPAKHILVILDACRTGIALDGVLQRHRGDDGCQHEPLARLQARRSRRIITSALGDQVALDSGPKHGHSLFTGCLLEGLSYDLRRRGDRTMTGSGLGTYLQRRVDAYTNSQQTPDFGTFYHDDRGELAIALVEQASDPSASYEPPESALGISRPLGQVSPIVQPSSGFASALCPTWVKEDGTDQYGHWALFEVNGSWQRMRWIPPGTFVMGSADPELGRYSDEGPQHVVTLTRAYWIAETPVTQALWSAVMGGNPSRFGSATADDWWRPVEQVSWNDCQMFLIRLNAMVPGLNARLPSEAEWERACRGGTTSATWRGALSDLRIDSALEFIAWYRGNSGKQTHPVGRKAPNPYGLHDMLGNVWEWCHDAAPASRHPLRYVETAVMDPVATGSGPNRVYRGGSWGSNARDVRAANRSAYLCEFRRDDLGFRVASAIFH